ncbi:MAG TPA: hypothetical protein VE642_14265 [Pyrinomonadaceae bacterium]|jgi:hypothetical protein|nr:hypothetical protein [Pyrinomonadaceae bacterium]
MKILFLTLILFSLLPPGSCKPGAKPAVNSNTVSAGSELDPRIPPPDPNKYRDILDAGDWQNPYLVIQAGGISLTANAASIKNRIISTDELARSLIALPVSAWPYGRVIAAQEVGIIGGVNDVPRIKQNKERVGRILKSLGLQVNWWPS